MCRQMRSSLIQHGTGDAFQRFTVASADHTPASQDRVEIRLLVNTGSLAESTQQAVTATPSLVLR